MPKAIKYCSKHDCDKIYNIDYKRYVCNICKTEFNKKYYLENINKIKENVKTYQSENIDSIKENHKKYRKDNIDLYTERDRINYINNKKEKLEYQHQYYLENKSKIIKQKCIYLKKRRKSDIIFKLRSDVSTLIRRSLKKDGYSKNSSIMDYLQYSIKELKAHLENKFEPWMNWNNHGIYNVNTWNDDNKLTWTWQIDHIIPQSNLPYINMKDENFKKCWSLENLRPLSSKQNILDGSLRNRHII